MSSPFIGEIRLFGFGFAPMGWALCQGQIYNKTQNQALFALLGTTFGGNGSTTFGLPNFIGRTAIGAGQGAGLSSFTYGASGGSTTHTLAMAELPAHSHPITATNATNDRTAASGNRWGASPQNPYSTAAGTVALSGSAVTSVGSSGSHPNEQPYLVLNFCISLSGIWPARS